MDEFEAKVAQGNHKSATSRLETLMEKLFKDFKDDFAIPIFKKIIKVILKSVVQPCGISRLFACKQTSLRFWKDRLTYNLR